MKINFRFKFIIIMILTILAFAEFMPMVSFAMNSGDMSVTQFDGSSYNLIDKHIGTSKNGVNITGKYIIVRGLGVILRAVRIIALSWAIICAFFIAIKYMSGSPQIKSMLKTDMPTYIIGAVLLFGSYGLLTLIQYFVEDNFKVS